MSNTLKLVIVAVVALVIGLLVGFFAGRGILERKWSQPYATIAPEEAARYADGDADPAPKSGAKVIKPMPIGRARVALAALTAKDTVVATGASVGADEKDTDLHVTVENRGTCKLIAASGIAYGFGPRGAAAATNKHGENLVAFKLETPLEPGKHTTVSQKLRYADAATLAIAQIDATECADGTSWKRP